MQKKITKTTVDALEPGALVWDTDVTRFGVRRRSGPPVYLVKYRHAGRQRWLRIGEHGSPWSPDTARREALRLLGLVAQGQDPAATKLAARTAPTVADLCARFLAEHVALKVKPSTAAEYRRLILTVITPKLGARLIHAVTRDDVARLHHLLRATPYSANRVLAVLGKLFALGERWGLRAMGTNPVRGLEKYRERSRERSLTDDELARLGAALEDAARDACTAHPATRDDGCRLCSLAGRVSPFIVAALRLLLLTGMRRGEVLALRWEDLDLERKLIRLPQHKTDRYGTKVLPLNEAARGVLAELPRIDGTPYIFAGRRDGAALRSLKSGWQKIRRAAGLADVRLHDLRHAHASVGVSEGLSLPLVGRLLGHTNPSTTQRYAHVAPDPVREASELISRTLVAAMTPAPVVPPEAPRITPGVRVRLTAAAAQIAPGRGAGTVTGMNGASVSVRWDGRRALETWSVAALTLGDGA